MALIKECGGGGSDAYKQFCRMGPSKFLGTSLHGIYKKEVEFLELTQASRTVLQYKARFIKLACAPHTAGDDERKAKKFRRGLGPIIRMRMQHQG